MLALLFALFAHLSPAPAPAPLHVAPAAVTVPVKRSGPPALPETRPEGAAPTVPPACDSGEEWDGLRCVALQLPEETTGRQYDPAD